MITNTGGRGGGITFSLMGASGEIRKTFLLTIAWYMYIFPGDCEYDSVYHYVFGLFCQMSLLGVIDNSGSECLNESDSHPFRHALSASTDQYLESDCDEQLIIVLAFQQPIKLHSIQLVGPTDGRCGCT